MGFKDLPGGQKSKSKKASTDFAKELSLTAKEKQPDKCK